MMELTQLLTIHSKCCFMEILYLVIEQGYEGIEKLIFPTLDETEAINKITEICIRI